MQVAPPAAGTSGKKSCSHLPAERRRAVADEQAADAVRRQAQKQGYSGREILEVDSRFDWSLLMAEANSLSLFAEQRIIDLRIPSGKPGNEGSKALNEYAEHPPHDVLLLITLPKRKKSVFQ